MGNQCLKKISDEKDGYKQHNQIVIDEDDDLGGSLGSFRGGALSSSNALSVASPDQVRRLVEQQMALSDELDIASRAAPPALSLSSKAPVFEDDQDGENEDEAFVKQGQAAWAQARSQMQSRISANTGAKTEVGNPFSIGDEDEDAFARELDQAMRQ